MVLGDGGVILIDAGSLAGSASGGSGGESVEVAGYCNDLRNDADPVTLSYVSEEPPLAIGGTPVQGRYHMTRFELFTGVDGPTSGETWDWARRIIITMLEDGSAEMASMEGELDELLAYQWNETLTFDGNSFTSTPTCHTRVVSIFDSAGLYSAIADQLVFMIPAPERAGTWVFTYTLQ